MKKGHFRRYDEAVFYLLFIHCWYTERVHVTTEQHINRAQSNQSADYLVNDHMYEILC